MYKLYKKVQKSEKNLYGVQELKETENPFLDGPCLLTWAAVDFMNEEIFGTLKSGIKMARLRTREETASKYQIINFPVSFLAVKNDNTVVEKKSLNLFIHNYLIPLISDNNNKIELNEAMKNMRNINIMANCNATYRLKEIEKILSEKTKELGYTLQESNSILSQICLFIMQSDVNIGDFKSTVIYFFDINDREVNLNIGTCQEKKLRERVKESPIKDTFALLSDNEAIYAINGTGEHRLGKYLKEGKAMPVVISKIISNALKNSVENFNNSTCFKQINIPLLTEGTKEIRYGALNNKTSQELMKTFDKELIYPGALKLSSQEEITLNNLDLLCDNIIIENRKKKHTSNDYR